jgi:hypothetical protein
VANDGHVEKVVESEVEDDAGYSQREELQRCALVVQQRVLRRTTIAETGTTVSRDALRLEALDNFAHTNPSLLRGVLHDPLFKAETFSLQRSLHERKRRTRKLHPNDTRGSRRSQVQDRLRRGLECIP